MADVSYQDPGAEFGKAQRSMMRDPWYVRVLQSLGIAKNKTQAGYILLGLAVVCVLATFFMWPEKTYTGPDPSGEPDPAKTR